MKTKREVVESIAKHKDCVISCSECPYFSFYTKKEKSCVAKKLLGIGAMAILRQNRKKREFDKNKILTSVTADQAKVGMKGYFADDLSELKDNFNSNALYKLSVIYNETYIYRFGNKMNDYVLFYPIDEVEE